MRPVILASAGLCLAACGRVGFDSSCPTSCIAPQTCGGGSIADACGASYYVAAQGGSDALSGRTPQAAWATFDHAWTVLQPGDALVLLDGTYNSEMHVPMSGTVDAPIAVRAARDGGAVIDGEALRVPCALYGTIDVPITDIIVEGIRCANSSYSVFEIIRAQRVTIRRVTAHDAAIAFNSSYSAFHSQDLLFEDIGAWGTGLFKFWTHNIDRSTFRRCWGRFDSHPGAYVNVMYMDGGSDNIVENCVAASSPALAGQTVTAYGLGATTGVTATNNRFVGNVAIGTEVDIAYIPSSDTSLMTSNRITHSVSIGATVGVYQRSDSDLGVDRVTIVGAGTAVGLSPNGMNPPGFVLSSDVRNTIIENAMTGFNVSSSPLFGSLTHVYNNLTSVTVPYSNTTADPSELSIDPAFDTATYGNGAYLIGSPALARSGEASSPIGAAILYRTIDGEVTDERLWPWPMEDRILAEAGVSVTYESQGGIWKTLDGVYR